MLLPKTRLQADERNGGVEDHRLTGEPLELRYLRGGVTGFAERRVAERQAEVRRLEAELQAQRGQGGGGAGGG